MISLKKGKILIIPAVVLVVILAFFLLLPAIRYHIALAQIEKGDYTQAYFHLLQCRGYQDSETLLENFSVAYETLRRGMTIYGDGAPESYEAKSNYRYDARGNKLLEQNYNAKGALFREIHGTFQYDEAGRLVLAHYQDGEGTVERSEYRYDEAGNVIYRAYENRELQLRSKHHSQYDAAGNEVLAERYDAEGRLLSRTKWAYDEMGNITRQDYYNDNTLLSTTLWEYQYGQDVAGRMTVKAQYNAKGDLDHRYEYAYDDKGNLLSESYYGSDGKLQDRYSWEYDHRGNLRRESRTDANGLLYEETIWSRDLRTKTTTHYTYRPDSTLEKTETETYTDPIAFYNP